MEHTPFTRTITLNTLRQAIAAGSPSLQHDTDADDDAAAAASIRTVSAPLHYDDFFRDYLQRNVWHLSAVRLLLLQVV